MGFVRVADLDTCLGLPKMHYRVTSSTFDFVVDKVHKKLSCWDARNLSLVGKITLVKSVKLFYEYDSHSGLGV